MDSHANCTKLKRNQLKHTQMTARRGSADPVSSSRSRPHSHSLPVQVSLFRPGWPGWCGCAQMAQSQSQCNAKIIDLAEGFTTSIDNKSRSQLLLTNQPNKRPSEQMSSASPASRSLVSYRRYQLRLANRGAQSRSDGGAPAPGSRPLMAAELGEPTVGGCETAGRQAGWTKFGQVSLLGEQIEVRKLIDS